MIILFIQIRVKEEYVVFCLAEYVKEIQAMKSTVNDVYILLDYYIKKIMSDKINKSKIAIEYL